MTEPLLIELTEDELELVSGGVSVKVGDVNILGIQQEARAKIVEVGGSIRIGGGRYSATSNTGPVSLGEGFGAAIDQSNSNSGSVTGNAVAG